MCAINSFYFMTFYHCIRHAVLLSIVLTLLSSVLSAILYNFNKWMNEQILQTEITDVKSRDGCQESCHAISKVAWSVYKHWHGMWLDSHSCERTSIGLQPRFRWPTAVFMEQRRRTLLGAFSSIWHRQSMSSTFWWHGQSAMLVVPSTRHSMLGKRAFSVASVRAWNSLLSSVRHALSLTTFRRELKTVLFSRRLTVIRWL